IKWAVGNTSEKQTLKSASVIQFNKSAAVLATVKGKSLRDGLRPPLTAAARSGQRKLGWDEEMVAVRSNKEMVKNSSLDTNRPIQVTFGDEDVAVRRDPNRARIMEIGDEQFGLEARRYLRSGGSRFCDHPGRIRCRSGGVWRGQVGDLAPNQGSIGAPITECSFAD